MSKHNYSQYSNNKKKNNEVVVEPLVDAIPDVVVEPVTAPEVKMVVETVDTVTLPETAVGVVVNCAKLNVRETPDADADVMCVLNAASEVEVDMAETTDEWVSVCTASGVKGYCMRKFVDVHL